MWITLLVVCFVSEPVGSSVYATRASEELEYEAATLKKHTVEEVLVKSEPGLGKHPAQLIKRSLVGEGIPEYILLGIWEVLKSGIIADNKAATGQPRIFKVIGHALGAYPYIIKGKVLSDDPPPAIGAELNRRGQSKPSLASSPEGPS